MALKLFISWTEADLATELRKCQEDLASGKTLTEWGAGDSRAANQITQSIERRIELILKALYALNPTTYPLASITRTSRTTALFNDR